MLAGTILDDRFIRCEHAKVNRQISISAQDGSALNEEQLRVFIAKNFGPTESVVFPDGPWTRQGSTKKTCLVKFVYRQDAIDCYGVGFFHHILREPF